MDAAVVVNEAQFSKFVHEKTHAGPGRADHLRKRLLADFRDHRLRFVFLAKVRQQQEQAGKTFLTRIEQLIVLASEAGHEDINQQPVVHTWSYKLKKPLDMI